MMRAIMILLAVFGGVPCLADVVVPTRTIRAAATITEHDITLNKGEDRNGFSDVGDVIGQEAQVVLYAGRPIMTDQIGPPAIIDRNQIVGMVFNGSGLQIATEARALERGAVGDFIRVMNLSSRAVLSGRIRADGTIQIF